MGDKNHEEMDTDFDVEDNNEPEFEDAELVDMEESSAAKMKKMREKISQCEEEKKKILDDSQRAKADFLNAKKRLEEDRLRDKVRTKKAHVEELLPLCDSFQMAMSNKEVWEQADEAWRSRIEGIYTQLTRLLDSYGVSEINPSGDEFDPHKHEAVGTEEVSDEKLEDKVISVVQKGYEIKLDGETEMIRPARVTTGKNN